MKGMTTCLGVAMVLAASLGARAQATSPDAAQIYSRDIPNFWKAIDRAAGKDSTAVFAAIREDYRIAPRAEMAPCANARFSMVRDVGTP